ncbi:MAG: hypothetical protein ABJA78_05305 [Ferruginibacter sp.]
MRLIKPLLIGIIGLSLVVTFISLLLPSEAHGRRGVVINAAKENVLVQINDFANWKHWHPDFAADSSKISYGKVTSGIDGSCDLKRANGRTDHYKFSSYNDTAVVVIQQRAGENDIKNIFTLVQDASSSGTYTDWKMITKLKWYPWEKFSGFFTESFAAPGMELALDNLKSYSERQ